MFKMKNQVLKNLDAVILTINLPFEVLSTPLAEKIFNSKEHKDSLESGVKSMLNLAFKTPFREVFKGFRYGAEKCNPKYRQLFENSYVQSYIENME